MSSLAVDLENTLRELDAPTAERLERLVRDALSLVHSNKAQVRPIPEVEHLDWLKRLGKLRDSVETGKQGTSTEAILEDLRSDRGE